MLPPYARAFATLTLVACVATSLPIAAFAQTDKAGAEALLNQGLSLKKAGNLAEACPKIEESLRLYPSLNTQYHLADCFELQGKTASAWIDFLEIAEKAHAAGETAKETKARERAAAIAGKVSHMTIAVATAAPGLEVKRAGVLVGKASWGSPMPMDPGDYEVVVTAPGKATYTTKATVAPNGADLVVTIPALGDASAATTASTTSSTTTSTNSTTDGGGPVVTDKPKGGSGKTIGLIIAGTGVVLMGVGGVLGLSAKSKYDGADCNGSACSSAGVDARDSARSTGNVATILFGVGAAALIGGGVLWLTSKSSSSASAGIAPKNDVTLKAGITPGGFVFGGSF